MMARDYSGFDPFDGNRMTTTQTYRSARRAKRTKNLSYALFAAAIVFAALVWWLEERGADSGQAASGFAVFLGLSVLSRAQSGLQSGRIRVRRTMADRSERPVAFWTVVSILTAAGFILTAAGVLNFFGLL